jgi:hypothetical protein
MLHATRSRVPRLTNDLDVLLAGQRMMTAATHRTEAKSSPNAAKGGEDDGFDNEMSHWLLAGTYHAEL